uniref:Putative secreted protein n=1 Tax=Anopheles darlingi TaxID=43151 RepID=A0A2M4D891_ANODA
MSDSQLSTCVGSSLFALTASGAFSRGRTFPGGTRLYTPPLCTIPLSYPSLDSLFLLQTTCKPDGWFFTLLLQLLMAS